ncbi:MAG: GtrA family protein [Acidimicrobiales bacterium]
MDLSRRALVELSRTPTGRKAIKYSVVSVVSIVVTLVTFAVVFNVLRVATAGWCQVIATAVGTVPSYTLNRYWAWGRRGRSHLLKEVIPFWVVAFIGLAFSVYAVELAADLGRHLGLSRLGVGVLAEVASLASYALLWVGKFIVFNRLLFVDRDKPGTRGTGEDGPLPGGAGPRPGEDTGASPVVGMPGPSL